MNAQKQLSISDTLPLFTSSEMVIVLMRCLVLVKTGCMIVFGCILIPKLLFLSNLYYYYVRLKESTKFDAIDTMNNKQLCNPIQFNNLSR